MGEDTSRVEGSPGCAESFDRMTRYLQRRVVAATQGWGRWSNYSPHSGPAQQSLNAMEAVAAICLYAETFFSALLLEDGRSEWTAVLRTASWQPGIKRDIK